MPSASRNMFVSGSLKHPAAIGLLLLARLPVGRSGSSRTTVRKAAANHPQLEVTAGGGMVGEPLPAFRDQMRPIIPLQHHPPGPRVDEQGHAATLRRGPPAPSVETTEAHHRAGEAARGGGASQP